MSVWDHEEEVTTFEREQAKRSQFIELIIKSRMASPALVARAAGWTPEEAARYQVALLRGLAADRKAQRLYLRKVQIVEMMRTKTTTEKQEGTLLEANTKNLAQGRCCCWRPLALPARLGSRQAPPRSLVGGAGSRRPSVGRVSRSCSTKSCRVAARPRRRRWAAARRTFWRA